MTDYPFEGQLIADPVTFQRAVNAQVYVYDAADTANATPLALKDTTGLPLANPLTSSADAFTRPFYAPVEDIKLVGAGLTVFVSSAKGMRDAAAAAAEAAQNAADSASTAAGNTVQSAAVDSSGALLLQKANGATVNAGVVKGAKGDKGDKGDKGADGANVLPTDAAIAQALQDPNSQTRAAGNATYASYKNLARNPDLLIAGAVTRDSNGAATSAPVVWPDGTPGTYTATTVSTAFPGAVDAYTITYGSPVIKTFTQPAITRDTTGAATNVPAITVS